MLLKSEGTKMVICTTLSVGEKDINTVAVFGVDGFPCLYTCLSSVEGHGRVGRVHK